MEQIQLASAVFLYATSGLFFLVLNAMYIIGLHQATKQPYILYNLEKKVNKILTSKGRFDFINSLKDNLYECLIGCVVCMASLHGTLFLTTAFFLFGLKKIYLVPILLFYIPALSFVIDVLTSIKSIIEIKIVKNS